MEFLKHYDFVSRMDVEDRHIPRIGTLHVSGEFHSSDGNFYPNHEVFGKSEGGSFPVYGELDIEYDDRNKPIKVRYLKNFFAHIPGVSYDGKEKYFYSFHRYGYELQEYVGKAKEIKDGVTFRIELLEPFKLIDDGGYHDKLEGFQLKWLNPIVLDIAYKANGDEIYYIDKDVSRQMGILRFGHEFSLYLNPDLSFRSAESLDCGETSTYADEAEFESRFPGFLAQIRDARDEGVLRVYHYEWDGKRNNWSIVPFPG